jgi:hypothetical protein
MAARSDVLEEEMILLIRADGAADELGRFESGRLKILSGIYGDVGRIWLSTALMQEGFPECQVFFDSIEAVDKPSNAILPVFFGQAEACLVTRSSFTNAAELNPQIGRQLKILASSPGFVLHIMCFRREYETEHKNVIMETANLLEEDPTGNQILLLFNTKKLVEFDPRRIEPVEKLLDEYNSLKAQRKKHAALKARGPQIHRERSEKHRM